MHFVQYHFLVIDVLDFLYCEQVSSIPKWFEFSGASSVRHKNNYSITHFVQVSGCWVVA